RMPISRKNPPNPLNTTFKCSDDRWIQIAFFQYDKWFPKFCDEVIERPDLKDTKYSTLRSAVNYVEEFVEMMEVEFAKRPVDEWCDRLQSAGIPYEKLATTEEVLEDPQCWENGYLHRHTFESGHEGVIFNTPVMFTEAPKPEYVRAPKLGEHTKEVLAEAGIGDAELEELKEKKVIL
ncbi:MAG: CoA transferase, partial [Peptostreptococcus sp.]|nr:CoA transferase [Peptostreptococcus sp.]